MPEATCDECGRAVWTSSPDTPPYCPDHVPDRGHSPRYQRQQAASVRANEHRHRVIANTTGQENRR